MEKNKINILLNGKKYLISKDSNIDELVKDLDLKNKSFALAINGEVVKKEAFKQFVIKANSKIEIISAVGGG
jgi:sulfur carrier protein